MNPTRFLLDSASTDIIKKQSAGGTCHSCGPTMGERGRFSVLVIQITK